MSTKLIDLDNRIITDTGEVVAKHELLVEKALSGEVFTKMLAVNHPDISLYNERTGFAHPIDIWNDTGEDTLEGPDLKTYDWTIPKRFLQLDITDLCSDALVEQQLVTPEYTNRLIWELQRMEEKEMFPFVRCLLYVTYQFKEKGVVWGVGRGSSCASLVMFLLDINRVDPVKYDIPAEEFFK
jgi:hypothetical protein